MNHISPERYICYCTVAMLIYHCYNYGVCKNMILMTFHGLNNDTSLSLHAAVRTRKHVSLSIPDFSTQQWKNLLCGVISAVKYLHEHQILHNDIKGDNIVIDNQDSEVRSVLVDLGKACYVHEAKKIFT